jgi:hypothetical protein
MRLPTFKRLIKSDYKEEYQSLIETLSFSINNGIESVYQALNNALSLKDNIACTVKDVSLEVDANGSPKTKTVFVLNTTNRILGICVLNAVNTKNPTVLPTSGVFISFVQENKNIVISSVKGLPANQPFTLSLVAFEG